MSLDSADRAVLARLADILIPGGEGFPPASEAGVASAGLDQVLASRPDLTDGLLRILRGSKDRNPAEVIAELQLKDRASFEILAEIIPGAYFMNSRVRALIGYHGQLPRPIDPRPDYLEGDLLQPVIDRGPIYRPTPGKPPAS